MSNAPAPLETSTDLETIVLPIRSDESKGQRQNCNYSWVTLFCVCIIINVLIFIVTGIGWLECYGSVYCENPQYPYGPKNDGGGNTPYTCCKTDNTWFDDSTCDRLSVTIKNCSLYDNWMWTFIANIITLTIISLTALCIYCIKQT